MKLCAIVLNYRDAVRTEACLRSLANQELDIVLVVDNSADQHFSGDLAEMLSRMKGHINYRLRLLKPDRNLGFARGVNLALGDADALECDAFLLINNDAVASQDMVARLAAALATDKSLMVAPTVVDETGVTQPMLWYQRYFGLQSKHRLPGSFPYLSGCCMLVRREMLEEGRLLDEDFFMYGEDTLLGWRLARSGKYPLILGNAFVRHAAGSARRGLLFYEYHMSRAHVLLAMKTLRHPIEVPLLLVSKGIGLCLRALWRCLRFGNLVPLKAFWMSWREKDIRVP
jgi:N-acetylglucosaminyl-diphospho-decaprenol L-rhamnosyltransferase